MTSGRPRCSKQRCEAMRRWTGSATGGTPRQHSKGAGSQKVECNLSKADGWGELDDGWRPFLPLAKSCHDAGGSCSSNGRLRRFGREKGREQTHSGSESSVKRLLAALLLWPNEFTLGLLELLASSEPSAPVVYACRSPRPSPPSSSSVAFSFLRRRREVEWTSFERREEPAIVESWLSRRSKSSSVVPRARSLILPIPRSMDDRSKPPRSTERVSEGVVEMAEASSGTLLRRRCLKTLESEASGEELDRGSSSPSIGRVGAAHVHSPVAASWTGFQSIWRRA